MDIFQSLIKREEILPARFKPPGGGSKNSLP